MRAWPSPTAMTAASGQVSSRWWNWQACGFVVFVLVVGGRSVGVVVVCGVRTLRNWCRKLVASSPALIASTCASHTRCTSKPSVPCHVDSILCDHVFRVSVRRCCCCCHTLHPMYTAHQTTHRAPPRSWPSARGAAPRWPSPAAGRTWTTKEGGDVRTVVSMTLEMGGNRRIIFTPLFNPTKTHHQRQQHARISRNAYRGPWAMSKGSWQGERAEGMAPQTREGKAPVVVNDWCWSWVCL